jgi:hypothetical protein
MRIRHWISTIFEFLVPLILSLLIAYIYSNVQSNDNRYDHKSDTKLSYRTESNGSDGKWLGPIIFSSPTMTIDSSHRFYGFIYYSPVNSFTNDLMTRIQRFGDFEIKGLANADLVNAKMESLASNDSTDINVLHNTYGLIFDNGLQSPESALDFNYTIRRIGDMSSLVKRLFPSKYFPGPAFDVYEYINYFCPLQTIINEAFLSKQTEAMGKERKQIQSMKAFKFPFPKYISKGKQDQVFSLQDLVAAAIVLGYVVMCPLIVKRITDEKVAKAKEMLRMMGYVMCRMSCVARNKFCKNLITISLIFKILD